MKLIDFLNMFYTFDTDIKKLVLWKNEKCLGDKELGDTRYIKPEYMNAKVKKFTIPKGRHALLVILEDEEEQ